ncbi:ABC transporter ATP-binding protein [Candidatus Pelagibacter ubique]|nr:ABC transporter ATP-binding protein [Candidatus Pelagibacter ubique]
MINYIKKHKLLLGSLYNRFLVLIFFFFLSSILELISISSLIPIINFFFNEKELFKLVNSIPIEVIKNYLTNLPSKNILIYVSFLAGIIYTLKGVFNTFIVFKIFRFTQKIKLYISEKIYKNYLYKDVLFFSQNKTEKILRTLSSDITNFSSHFCTCLSMFIAEVFIIFSLVLFLIYFAPIVSLALILFAIIIYFANTLYIRKKLINISYERQIEESNQLKLINYLSKLITEIKIYSKQDKFFNNFFLSLNQLEKLVFKFNIISNMPKYIFETILFLIIIIFLMVNVLFFQIGNNFAATLSLIVIIILRILPSLIRCTNLFTVINYYSSSFNHLYEELKHYSYSDNKIKKISLNKIELKNICYRYPYKSQNIFAGLNLVIKKGDRVGIKGNSGAGKSTLTKIIAGLIKPNSGKIILNNLRTINNNSLKIGYVSQNIFLLDDSLVNNIIFEGIKEKKKVNKYKLKKILDICCLNDLVKELPKKTNAQIGESGIKLSGGQKQRISIARALYANPDLIILDEATNALDKSTENKILRNIFRYYKDKTIIIVSHNYNILKLCNNIINLNKKKVSYKLIDKLL